MQKALETRCLGLIGSHLVGRLLAIKARNLDLRENTSADELAEIATGVLALQGARRRHAGGRHGWRADNPVVRLSTEGIGSSVGD